MCLRELIPTGRISKRAIVAQLENVTAPVAQAGIRHRICVPQRQFGVVRNKYSYRSRLRPCNRTRGGLDPQIKSYGLSDSHHPAKSMHFPPLLATGIFGGENLPPCADLPCARSVMSASSPLSGRGPKKPKEKTSQTPERTL
jgi:hypothetical protein